jgi:methionyl-tRNA formyltransferase
MAWRVVIATRILPVALGFHAAIREAGHEPVGLLTIRDPERRYGDWDVSTLVDGAPPELDLLLAAKRSSLAPLLESKEPDLVVCMGFPWKVPAPALAVPRLGWLNGHPSLLPNHRGPIPLSWAIRSGDVESGVSFHFMDADFDTGPLVAQRRYPLGEPTEPEAFFERLGPVVVETLAEALEKIAAGDRGTPQEGGTYETFFTADDVWLDPSQTAAEQHRLAWAWRYTPAIGAPVQGLLVDVDGETVRVLESSLVEVEGATRVDCADGPLWLVRTERLPEPAPAAAARPT